MNELLLCNVKFCRHLPRSSNRPLVLSVGVSFSMWVVSVSLFASIVYRMFSFTSIKPLLGRSIFSRQRLAREGHDGAFVGTVDVHVILHFVILVSQLIVETAVVC